MPLQQLSKPHLKLIRTQVITSLTLLLVYYYIIATSHLTAHKIIKKQNLVTGNNENTCTTDVTIAINVLYLLPQVLTVFSSMSRQGIRTLAAAPFLTTFTSLATLSEVRPFSVVSVHSNCQKLGVFLISKLNI